MFGGEHCNTVTLPDCSAGCWRGELSASSSGTSGVSDGSPHVTEAATAGAGCLLGRASSVSALWRFLTSMSLAPRGRSGSWCGTMGGEAFGFSLRLYPASSFSSCARLKASNASGEQCGEHSRGSVWSCVRPQASSRSFLLFLSVGKQWKLTSLPLLFWHWKVHPKAAQCGTLL